MHARTSIPIALAGVALIFCAAADGRAPQTKLRKHLQPPSAAQDCVLLPKAEVVRQFPAAPPTLSVRTRESPYPSCTFLWTPLAQAERTIGGQRVRVPGQGRLTVTRAALHDPDADWARVMSSYRGETPLVVERLGKRAVWSARRSQVSVQGSTHVFHVMVEDSDAPKAVRERAEAIARVLLRGER